MHHRREDHHRLRQWWRSSGDRLLRWPEAALVAIGGPLARRLFQLRVEGDQHLPESGDHRRQPPVLLRPRRSGLVRPPSGDVHRKAEYLENWKTRLVLPALGMIPLDRDNPRRAFGALAQAAGVLGGEELFAIYPEGTRSRDGALHAGHSGVGHLSMATGVSVVPTGIVDTDRIQPPGARLPRPFTPADVRFGAPIDPTAYAGTRRERRRRISSDVMDAIAELTGQIRGDDFAGHDRRLQRQARQESAADSVTGGPPPVGEMIDIDERVVVSPRCRRVHAADQ